MKPQDNESQKAHLYGNHRAPATKTFETYDMNLLSYINIFLCAGRIACHHSISNLFQ
jgi:hypothetical protein